MSEGAVFYRGRERLDAMIEDHSIDIAEVIAEVERLCRGDAHAAVYYRENPHLNYRGHPWHQYVATGQAEHLGWSREEGHV